MVALNEVVSAEGLTLDPALLAQLEQDKSQLKGRGVGARNTKYPEESHLSQTQLLCNMRIRTLVSAIVARLSLRLFA